MKGSAKIELINSKTGEVRSVIEENIITAAIEDAIKMGMSERNMFGTLSLILADLFEGCALMAEPQDLSKYYPSGKFIGLAGASTSRVDTSTPELDGLKVTAETKAITNGHQYCWQWGTGNANGTINSICLHPRQLADEPTKRLYYQTVCDAPPLYNRSIGNNAINNIYLGPGLYISKANTSSGFDINLYRSKLTPTSNINSLTGVGIVERTLMSVDSSTEFMAYVTQFILKDDILYCIIRRRLSPHGAVLKRAVFSTGEQLPDINLPNGSVDSQSSQYDIQFDVNNNYIVRCERMTASEEASGLYMGRCIEVNDINTGASVRRILLPKTGVGPPISYGQRLRIEFVGDGDIVEVRDCYITSNSYNFQSSFLLVDVATGIINLSRGEIIQSSEMCRYYGRLVYSDKNKSSKLMAYHYEVAQQTTTNQMYHSLAQTTINNLDTPLVKTDQDILKVTYIITY